MYVYGAVLVQTGALSGGGECGQSMNLIFHLQPGLRWRMHGAFMHLLEPHHISGSSHLVITAET